MIPLRKALESSVGKKFVMSISGIALVLFIIVHLLGNLPLYFGESGGTALNEYAAALAGFGPALYVAEIGLLVVFVVHALWAFRVTAANKKARSQRYQAGLKSKGGPSNMNAASRNMIITGVVLLVFLIIHVWQFRVGKVGYEETVVLASGEEAVNLYHLVVTTFKNPINVLFYMGVMLFLGAHLSHGFWSAIQSLGAMKPQWSRAIYGLGVTIAVVLAVGFFFIPLWLFLFADVSGA